MKYTINQIAAIINANTSTINNDVIEHLLTDSRRLVTPATTIFFAIDAPRRSGRDFIDELYNAGVKNFIVQHEISNAYPDANFLQVNNVVSALQQIAAHHRNLYDYPVIGITGSNGKTIVKEWLYQLLHADYNIVRSPRSYNSQIGVPLSIWQMSAANNLAIIEAGISAPGEMCKLEKMIKPTIAVFTNIGAAHASGFFSYNEKAKEKALLAANAQVIIFNNDDQLLATAMQNYTGIKLSYGKTADAAIQITTVTSQYSTAFQATHQTQKIKFTLPFIDAASVENATTCLCVLLYLNIDKHAIAQRMLQLQPVALRMQLQKGLNNCYILNDSYSNDVVSLSIAITYLKQQAAGKKTTVVLTDFAEPINNNYSVFFKIVELLNNNKIERLIAVGPAFSSYLKSNNGFNGKAINFNTVSQLLQHINAHYFKDEFILLKGARIFQLERLGQTLEHKVHQTVMEINLAAITHNLKVYQSLLLPKTKIMAMVKAFGYGSGSSEVAKLLQFNKVDYLAVAYADEGIELRKAGISLPIVVMNIDEAGFNALVEYSLEPVIYSFTILKQFYNYILQQGIDGFAVHIKFDTGMHRLGFEEADMIGIIEFLNNNKQLVIRSAFTHFAASDEGMHDSFTQKQATLFTMLCKTLEQAVGYNFLRHASNSAGISRHAHLQFDMVRLGIGLYGIDSNPKVQKQLQVVAALKTTIAQIRKVTAGETVGYNRNGAVDTDKIIATVRIGYADGYSRKYGNGTGFMWVKEKLVPVIGNVCMDMTMIDITGIDDVTENDIVEIFGENIDIKIMAAAGKTISYEVLTGISQRVTRMYLDE